MTAPQVGRERGSATPAAEAMRQLLSEGERAERRGDLVAAANAYTTASASDDPHVAGEAAFRLGRVAWRQGRLDDALELYERARSRASELNDDELRASAENGIGAVHHQRGALTQARVSYRIAFDLTRSPALRGRVYLNLGALATFEGDTAQARELYGRSIQALEQVQDEAGLALAMHNLALLHADAGAWEEAEEAYDACLELSERVGDRQMIASVLLNRVELLSAHERFDEAMASCARALTLFTDLGDEVGRAAVLRWEGQLLRLMGRLDDAEPRLKEVIRIAMRLQIAPLEAEAARELGLVRLARDDTTGATKWLRRALARFSLMGADREAADVEEHLLALKSAPQRKPVGESVV
jgi:tetratricopeptide (TPR) repeat protein